MNGLEKIISLAIRDAVCVSGREPPGPSSGGSDAWVGLAEFPIAFAVPGSVGLLVSREEFLIGAGGKLAVQRFADLVIHKIDRLFKIDLAAVNVDNLHDDTSFRLFFVLSVLLYSLYHQIGGM